MIRVALDAMSGDRGLEITVGGALHALKTHADLEIILVGNKTEIEALVPGVPERIKISHASEVVAMDELPLSAMRSKKDSSMRVAINLVREGEADAVVSAGNTGAFMATARFALKMMAGVDRPVLCTSLPTVRGPVWVLDLGANIDSTSKHLLQFALMGNALVKILTGNKPKVGLLNIGEEEIKGNDVIKQTASLLHDSKVNYHGFVEGDDIFKGNVDLVVCDGFIGNVALKSSEGVAKMVRYFLYKEFTKSWYRKFVGLLARPVLNSLKSKIDPRVYNGASLLGLQGVAVKSHGSTDIKGISSAISVAYEEASHNLLEKVQEELSANIY